MKIALKMTKDDMTELIYVRKTWGQLDGVGVISEEVVSKGEKINTAERTICGD